MMLLKKWEQLPPEMQTDEVRKYYDILKKKQADCPKTKKSLEKLCEK